MAKGELNHNMKRLGIFCIYDKEGIIDDYILYLLQEIKKVLDHVAIVCNGKLLPEGRARLEKYTDDIFVRENTGFDMAAWKHGILDKKDELKNYDELVLFNDSFYGPFYPFQDVFDEMDKKGNADFWGLTIHGKTEATTTVFPDGWIQEHVQSFFLVIRSRMLHSKEFIAYWSMSDEAQSFQDAITWHEVLFTKNFYEKGFTYDVYCDTRKWESECTVNVNHYIYSTEKLLKDYHCPVIKKKVFLFPREKYILATYGGNPRRSLDFIKKHTNYDEKLIWQNLLRNQNIAETKAVFGLDYILPTDTQISDVTPIFKDTVIIAHLYYEDLIPLCVEYLCNAPKEISLVVTVSDKDKKKIIENTFKKFGRTAEVRLVSNRGRDLSALFVGCADLFDKFKYLCFIHDKKSIRVGESIAIGTSFFNLLWRNMLGSETYIKNILSKFESETWLGLLAPPHPYHGGYSYLLFTEKFWSNVCFDKTVELAETLDIPKNFIELKYTPLAIGSVFWCRTEALKKITSKGWKVEDFPEEPMAFDGTISHALERILAFAAQASGFYTGWAMTSDFAKDELENFFHFALNTSNKNPVMVPAPTPPISLADFLRLRIPHKYWGILRPFKRALEKLGLIRQEPPAP
ncbi:MAG: hypothetical protein IJS81_00070 [Selenomonadaceae bacterium]|nr:hypothetical protein [Selenomonadaceae bacterium]